MSFQNSSSPAARKDYRCRLCDGVIPKGERHERVAGKQDGDFFSARFHAACLAHTEGWDEDEWATHDAAEFRNAYGVTR